MRKYLIFIDTQNGRRIAYHQSEGKLKMLEVTCKEDLKVPWSNYLGFNGVARLVIAIHIFCNEDICGVELIKTS